MLKYSKSYYCMVSKGKRTLTDVGSKYSGGSGAYYRGAEKGGCWGTKESGRTGDFTCWTVSTQT